MNKKKAHVVAAVLVLATVAASIGITLSTVEETEITVNRVERVTSGSGEGLTSKYMVYADSETFQNTDSVLFMKWNSSDIHGMLKEGESYHVKVCGFRVPFLSMHRNIISVQ